MATVLDQEIYTEPEAARLLGVAPSTLHYWLQGGERRGATYMPVIRAEPVESRYVTWAEFIEAGWLRAYRTNKVPMRELRRFIELLRDELGVPYPLAHKKPLVSVRKLVFQAQEAAELELYWRLVDEQLVLTYPGQLFMDRVTWEGDLAVGRATSRRAGVDRPGAPRGAFRSPVGKRNQHASHLRVRRGGRIPSRDLRGVRPEPRGCPLGPRLRERATRGLTST